MSDNNGSRPIEVDPTLVIAKLGQRVLDLIRELAIKDAYIDRLHQALADVAGGRSDDPLVPGSDT